MCDVIAKVLSLQMNCVTFDLCGVATRLIVLPVYTTPINPGSIILGTTQLAAEIVAGGEE